MEILPDFLCPISMELMKDPVTISTGVSYERKNIEKWFFTYKKKTCPATMQSIKNFDITPNHTLKAIILQYSRQPSINHDDMLCLLNTVKTSPFKVSSLKKLRSIIEKGDEIVKADFIQSKGVEVLVEIVVQVAFESSHDFIAFRACEEAMGVLQNLPFSEEEKTTFDLLSKQEAMKSMAIMLQRGSAESRLYTITIFQKMAKSGYDWHFVIQDVDFFKALLEMVSDEICTKASSCALEVLIEILGSSKKSRLRAIEAGAVCVLIELLPDSNRSKCEKVLVLIKLLCECAEGRQALVEHGMGIPAISKRMLHVSTTATKMVVKILWVISSFHPTERVLEEMLVYGSVKKLLVLLHIDGRSSSTKDKVIKMIKLHGNSWKRYPCFPCELKEYMAFVSN
ncbi:E3 ubiquitin-protein ligase PUB23-like [Corylus avellana]|uniref:E3 ubiquitin-protein ligase PUB23-like n=1 Tax=Corylus avellana TaxID=13451 RepID=UPI001E1F8295|nr:E3 ubiquitin-protein ligase PUB23-like [Corylus avellana]